VAGFRSLRVVVEVGEPMSPEADSPVEFKDQVRERVIELVAAARARLAGTEQRHRRLTTSTAG
jgi:hypothetical protein